MAGDFIDERDIFVNYNTKCFFIKLLTIMGKDFVSYICELGAAGATQKT